MNTKRKQSGITLMEMTVVVAVVALLTVLGLPAISAFFDSLASSGPTKAMISAALSSARAIAVKERHYAGIRFQKAYEPNNALEAPQYMVFIVHDFDKTGLADGFRAVEGLEPIKLPEAVGVMDLMVREKHAPTEAGALVATDRPIEVDDLDDTDPANLVDGTTNRNVTDTTGFSLIFSPSGKLVIHYVRVRNRDGDFRPETPADSEDDIFNSPENIASYNTGMFVHDDYAEHGLGREPSRNSFVMYDKAKFNVMDKTARFDYLQNLDKIYINPYVGTIIER